MKITEIRVFLKDSSMGDGKLKAFATVTFDSVFVVRDLKIIEGKTGRFVAMPSSRLTFPCPKCRKKNYPCSKFCTECGANLVELNFVQRCDVAKAEHHDIAHPITSDMRKYLQNAILKAYDETCACGKCDTITKLSC